MPQSLAQIYLHVVFSTKNRAPYLYHTSAREEIHAYLGGACRNLGSPPIIVGGVADHVHVLCRLGKVIRVSDFVRDVKRESSKWVKEQSADLVSFYWQNGYGAFSVGPEHLDALSAYIAGQDAHHRSETFQTEYRRFLREYRIDYDERYVWD